MPSKREAPPRHPFAFDLKVTLRDIEPPVWRRLRVPAEIPLRDLHQILQTAFSWQECHLHAFEIAGNRYERLNPEWDQEPTTLADNKTWLCDVVSAGDHFLYEYDFGDNWEHEIVVEAAHATEPLVPFALCLGGARAAPPEDVGSTSGYEEFLAALRDPEHEDHDRFLVWVGGAWDPESFDANLINRRLRGWYAKFKKVGARRKAPGQVVRPGARRGRRG